MPWIPMYLKPADLPQLLDILGDDIVPIVSEGGGKWRAVRNLQDLHEPHYALWHIPSGPLPLYTMDGKKRWVANPFEGWTELRAGADNSVPYFGSGHVGIFTLNLRFQGKEPHSTCGLSSIGWIGNRYRVIGQPAPDVTVKRWAKLKRQITKVATKFPRGGPDSTGVPEIWAFEKAKAGLGRADINPF